MDDASDKTQTSDEARSDGEAAEARLIWQSAPGKCSRCWRNLYAPRPVARVGDELLCYDCAFRHLSPGYFLGNRRGKKLEEPPDAVILWLNERGECSVCSNDLATPGPVGVTPKGAVCILCLESAAPTLSWILRLASAVMRAQGYWPGMPRYERQPDLGPMPEPPDWRKALMSERWPSALGKIPGGSG